MGRTKLIVETSALVAILLEEPETPELLTKIESSERRITTVVSAFETMISLGRALGNRELASGLVPLLFEEAGIEMVGIEPTLYEDLVAAYVRYGKGTGHAAQLNFGDCFSYAVAKRAKMPLLYKGEDFSKTDLA